MKPCSPPTLLQLTGNDAAPRRFTPYRQAVILQTRIYHVDLTWCARYREALPLLLNPTLDDERGHVSAGR
jgi:hypothetical protein